MTTKRGSEQEAIIKIVFKSQTFYNQQYTYTCIVESNITYKISLLLQKQQQQCFANKENIYIRIKYISWILLHIYAIYKIYIILYFLNAFCNITNIGTCCALCTFCSCEKLQNQVKNTIILKCSFFNYSQFVFCYQLQIIILDIVLQFSKLLLKYNFEAYSFLIPLDLIFLQQSNSNSGLFCFGENIFTGNFSKFSKLISKLISLLLLPTSFIRFLFFLNFQSILCLYDFYKIYMRQSQHFFVKVLKTYNMRLRSFLFSFFYFVFIFKNVCGVDQNLKAVIFYRQQFIKYYGCAFCQRVFEMWSFVYEGWRVLIVYVLDIREQQF
eukprot:TRINITY_DN4101_c1_g1_i3.p1 TRINITY_DN4101_c1_g1~~TRINITY_DN4101_c1_g1_i3.p1  ORF type:complete len:325 (-),score=-7.73 TRINITY_DN4101_c1_g1_i3:59-1033(-)